MSSVNIGSSKLNIGFGFNKDLKDILTRVKSLKLYNQSSNYRGFKRNGKTPFSFSLAREISVCCFFFYSP